MFKDFREFAFKGNVLDLAVGVIIGAAFGTIVKSLVEDMITPVIGGIFGKVDLTDKFVTLNGAAYPTLAAAKAASAPVIGYGAFLTALLNFLILAAVVYFCIVRPAKRFELAGGEKVDLAEKNVQQNARIIELLEKLTNEPSLASQAAPTQTPQ